MGAGTQTPQPADAPSCLVVLNIEDGKELWRRPLAGTPVRDGLAVDAKGRVFVALDDGRVLGFASEVK
jgi:outer membrane protein assembly factor BamB